MYKRNNITPIRRPQVAMPQPTTFRICPTCKCELRSEKDHGWVYGGFDEQNKKTIIKPCPTCSSDASVQVASLAQADLVTRLFGGSQIPHRARNWTFDTYPQDADQNSLEQVKDFVALHLSGNETEKRGLYLGGAAGRCKTGLAISALKAFIGEGKVGLFVMTSDLMDRLRATFSKDSHESQDELLKAITDVDVVLFDDLGVEKPSPFVIERFYLIVEKRRNKGLYTIFTSNFSTKDLEAYWRPEGVQAGAFHAGVRVTERLREYCLGISLRGRNQREKGAR